VVVIRVLSQCAPADHRGAAGEAGSGDTVHRSGRFEPEYLEPLREALVSAGALDVKSGLRI
jgi:hypothetical protein